LKIIIKDKNEKSVFKLTMQTDLSVSMDDKIVNCVVDTFMMYNTYDDLILVIEK